MDAVLALQHAGFQNQNPILANKMAAVLALKLGFKTKIRFWQAKWPPFWPWNCLSKPKSDFGKQNGRRFGIEIRFLNENPILTSKMAAVLALQLGFKTKIRFWQAKWTPFWPCNMQAFKTKIRFWQTKWPPFWH